MYRTVQSEAFSHSYIHISISAKLNAKHIAGSNPRKALIIAK